MAEVLGSEYHPRLTGGTLESSEESYATVGSKRGLKCLPVLAQSRLQFRDPRFGGLACGGFFSP
ncbi:MAG: hypothetical protein OXC25_09955, partial [Thiotrichales bacterium]|nr:hypothetical protein [Thiotrichales bacterium]